MSEEEQRNHGGQNMEQQQLQSVNWYQILTVIGFQFSINDKCTTVITVEQAVEHAQIFRMNKFHFKNERVIASILMVFCLSDFIDSDSNRLEEEDAADRWWLTFFCVANGQQEILVFCRQMGGLWRAFSFSLLNPIYN